MTNKERDENLYIYANCTSYPRAASRIITPQGSQFIANKIEFGGYEGTGYANVKLVQDVGVAAEMSFEGVPPQVNQLALIELLVKSNSSGRFAVQFRGVPISN